MPSVSDVLSNVWQEVCRHLEIDESVDAVAKMLRGQLPLGRLVVRRFEPEHGRLRVVAATPAGDDDQPGELELSDQVAHQLGRWLNHQAPIHATKADAKSKRLLQQIGCVPTGNDWFVAPLVGEHGSRGIVTAVATHAKRFSAAHAALLAAVVEPLAAALDNDARLHEIAALREAAEADRRSLLRRLGRRNVGDTIVGEESGLRQVIERVDMVSRSDVPVLILGETGTGKELVARAIHNRSDRHAGPFIRVNCGAIPRELIDSHLFGHEKGSFTGATDTREGWFERADMGTLLLDEIGELPLEAQIRFLRVLQDGFIERVGGTKQIRVNVRVVASTHRDLAAMVRENSFREDLWYRIAVFPILLPPLRERSEDIPALARHFAERAAVRFGLAPVMPDLRDVELLQTYDWPGNIRELATVIDRAAILGNGRTLEIAAALGLATPRWPHDPGVVRGSPGVVRGSPDPAQAIADLRSPQWHGRETGHSLGVLPLDEAMRQHIEAALEAARGRIEGSHGAARLLEINPHTLRARMRKLGIDWGAYRNRG
jgi:hydrogenase-4 transcriptional activator